MLPAGSAGMLFLGVDAPVIAIVAVTLVFGITIGTTSIGNQTALYTQVPITRVGGTETSPQTKTRFIRDGDGWRHFPVLP